jgi:Putative F0F1-ATPase subunit Ca2+/Mg2+ transporter
VKREERNSWAKAGAYTGLAFIIPVAMLACYYLGQWADSKLGTNFLAIVGIMAGFGAGLWETLRQADRIEHGLRTGTKDRDNTGNGKG